MWLRNRCHFSCLRVCSTFPPSFSTLLCSGNCLSQAASSSGFQSGRTNRRLVGRRRAETKVFLPCYLTLGPLCLFHGSSSPPSRSNVTPDSFTLLGGPDSEFWQCHLLLPPPAIPLARRLLALPVFVNVLIAPGSLVQFSSISVILVINSLLYYNVNSRQARVFTCFLCCSITCITVEL